ncbi:hypothetical protein [Ralstonia pseudosolanacearum]|uniref:hypothetical protein n=1 Tax=Ralstonia pseudosolanacearum TaxID=1310165 RepID=UPI003CE80D0E
MKVKITPLRCKGVQRQKWMRAMGNVRGDLFIGDRRDTINHRMTRAAELRNTDDPQHRSWILFDVQLLWWKDSHLLLGGSERQVEWSGATTDYAQTWLVSLQDVDGTPPGPAETTPALQEDHEHPTTIDTLP